MSKIPGVGYTPSPGNCFWVWPGGASAGTTPFNPDTADPFTAAGGQLDLGAFNARYGGRPVRADGTIGMFVVDAETVLGSLTRAMELAAAQGLEPAFTGRPDTHTMIPTIREAHDYAATHQDGGKSLMYRMGVGGGASGHGGSSQLPGQPRIETIASPAPGRISLAWITGQADSFEIEMFPSMGEVVRTRVEDPKQGNRRSAVIDLPAGHGGIVGVSVRAFRGATGGKWSIHRRVTVEPHQGAAGKPEEPPKKPTDITEDVEAMEAIRLLKRLGYSRDQVVLAYGVL